MVGPPPRQQLPQVWEGWPASWAVRVAGPLVTITMSLCAGTAVANGAEKWPLLSTRGEWGEGGPQGAPSYTCTCTQTCTQHMTPGVRDYSPSATTQDTSPWVHVPVSPAFVAPT